MIYSKLVRRRCFISKIENTVTWTYVISNLYAELNAETFMKNNCKKLLRKNTV